MIRRLVGVLVAGLLSFSAVAAAPSPTAPAPLAELVRAVDIPYSKFVLPNGLTVIVAPDRKAPLVAVSVWYHVGSRFEPAGKTGFAHLFEHLMFGGSENVPKFDEPLENVGASDNNGTTFFDRTNYFETVPTGALDLVLFMEADRMGHLLGAVTQTKLDVQRGVVQNEKRENDNQPYGLVDYAQLTALFPPGHPYRHPTIGSMADLNRASLATVHEWFKQHYGPNNAVLVLAGDIDEATARAKVTRWFGAIPRGPESADVPASVTVLPKEVIQAMTDRIATVRLYRNWVVPGLNDPEAPRLDLAMSILGGLNSSRLDNILVRQEKLAVSVSAGVQSFEKVGIAEVTVDVTPGVDPVAVGKRLDAILAEFIKNGPTDDEVLRASTREAAGTIAGLEQVGGFSGKAATLAQGQLYSKDPEKYRRDLAAYAAATPETIRAAAAKWFGKPAYRLTVSPGPRTESGDNLGDGTAGGSVAPQPAAGSTAAPAAPAPAAAPASPRIKAPPVAQIADVVFPKIERGRLSNGIPVLFARRDTVPAVRVALAFEGGASADPKDRLGTSALMNSLLDEGTTTRSSEQIAAEQERLGASISPSASIDRTQVSMFALKPNLAASLDLLADIVRHPAFAPTEIERMRTALLTRIAAEYTEPTSIALRTLPPLLYGPANPYGIPFTGSGDEAGVKAISRTDLLAFHERWIRPDTATIFVVGDTSLAEVVPLLEARFGDWKPPATPRGTKLFRQDRMLRPSRIILIDRPQSPQSMILAGQLLPTRGLDDPLTLLTANEVLGGGITSRLMQDLREQKGWAYGVATQVRMARETLPWLIYAPVQTDKTGASIKAILDDTRAFLTKAGVTRAERDRTINSQIRQLPSAFETSGDLLSAMIRNDTFRRPDDYYAKQPMRYRAMTAAGLDRAARAAIDPSKLLWVVVGDAKLVRPQLEGLGLPVEEQPGLASPAGDPAPQAAE
jgi:predicted Zn-dependent peptidase